MKKQIWFEPHQVDLVTLILTDFNGRLCSGSTTHESYLNSAEKKARIFTQRRIDEVLKLFGKES